jgi:tetratricopeptide (TPR) repeat protein
MTNPNKISTDLQRLLETQNFQSEEELRAFLESLMGQQIPSFEKEALSTEEQAEDLIFEAHGMSPSKAKKNIYKALELDQNCIPAYELLGILEESLHVATIFFEKGVNLGKERFGGDYLNNRRGMFWGFHETRPYMRCLHQYAECHYYLGNLAKSIEIYKEIIDLNNDDNQGVRGPFMLLLLLVNEFGEYLNYHEIFGLESSAFSLFNHALFKFKTEGTNANKILQQAISYNPFVAEKLISTSTINYDIDSYSPGQESEADVYAKYSAIVWNSTEGAIKWLTEQR